MILDVPEVTTLTKHCGNSDLIHDQIQNTRKHCENCHDIPLPSLYLTLALTVSVQAPDSGTASAARRRGPGTQPGRGRGERSMLYSVYT